MCQKLIKNVIVTLTLPFPLSAFIIPTNVFHLQAAWCLTSCSHSETGSAGLEPPGGLTDLCRISRTPGLSPISLTHWWHDLCRLLSSFLVPNLVHAVIVPLWSWNSCPLNPHGISVITPVSSNSQNLYLSRFPVVRRGNCHSQMEILPYPFFLWTKNIFLNKTG